MIGGQRLMRDATASLLGAQPDLGVLGSFESPAHYLATGPEHPPAILLLDCDGCAPGGCEDAIASLSPPDGEWRLVLLCREISEEVVRCAVLQGVGGVVLKSYSRQDLCSALRYIATGRTVMPVGWQRLARPSPRGEPELSPRQREILGLIVEGLSSRAIADELGLSANTVKFHIRVLYSRLGVRNRVEAANRHAQMSCGGS